MKKKLFKKAFTLAEIMIVLTVVGILTAILLPSAFNSSPDEQVMKFKKANSTFYSLVKEMVTSGKYYYPGCLIKKPSEDAKTCMELEDPSDPSSNQIAEDAGDNHMCQVVADLISAKTVDCSVDNSGQNIVYYEAFTDSTDSNCETNICNTENVKKKLDGKTDPDKIVGICTNIANPKGVETSDGIIFYEANKKSSGLVDPDCDASTNVECNNAYKVFCIRIGDESFGYGIRSDGKIITGVNVDRFTSKSIQSSD